MKETADNQYWSMTEGVFNCLIDSVRTKAFAKAIKKTVSRGDVVVDMGTGSGILAMLAAKAGAKKVYAVEIDPNNIKTLRNTFKKNGYENTIEVIEGSILEAELPEKVDVVIGEMIATALIEELQVLAMNHILKYSKKNVKVLLNKYDTSVDLVHNQNNYYGFSFDILRYEYSEEKDLESTTFSRKTIVQSYNFSKPVKNLIVKNKFPVEISKSGTINGVRLSGKTTFHDGSTLGGTFAYDYPLILPISETVVKKGETYVVDLQYKVCGGMNTLKYSLNKK
jgi:predicted RNA methylase